MGKGEHRVEEAKNMLLWIPFLAIFLKLGTLYVEE